MKKDSMPIICPACQHSFDATRVVGRPRVIRKATDFREVYADNERVLPYCVAVCPACAYAGYPQWFDGREIDFAMKGLIASQLLWNLPWALTDPVERFHHALKCAEWDTLAPKELGDLALNGAWCAEEEGDREAERWFRREAIRHYDVALKRFDGVEPALRGAVTYLMGELYRRLDDLALSTAWFSQVANEATDDVNGKWVQRWAYEQRTDPKEFFT